MVRVRAGVRVLEADLGIALDVLARAEPPFGGCGPS